MKISRRKIPPGHMDRLILFLVPWTGAIVTMEIADAIAAATDYTLTGLVVVLGAISLGTLATTTLFHRLLDKALAKHVSWVIGLALAKWSRDPWTMEKMVRRAKASFDPIIDEAWKGQSS